MPKSTDQSKRQVRFRAHAFNEHAYISFTRHCPKALCLPLKQLFTPALLQERSNGSCYGLALQASAHWELTRTLLGYTDTELENIQAHLKNPSPVFCNRLLDWELAEQLQAAQHQGIGAFQFPGQQNWVQFKEEISNTFYLPKNAHNLVSFILSKLNTPRTRTSIALHLYGYHTQFNHTISILRKGTHYYLIDPNFFLFRTRSEEEFREAFFWLLANKYPEKHFNTFAISRFEFHLQQSRDWLSWFSSINKKILAGSSLVLMAFTLFIFSLTTVPLVAQAVLTLVWAATALCWLTIEFATARTTPTTMASSEPPLSLPAPAPKLFQHYRAIRPSNGTSRIDDWSIDLLDRNDKQPKKPRAKEV